MGHVCTMWTIKGPSSRASAHWALQMQFKTQILRKTRRELSTSEPLKAEASTLSTAGRLSTAEGLDTFYTCSPWHQKGQKGKEGKYYWL